MSVISLSQSKLIDVNVSLELEIILTYTWFILHLFADPNLFCNFNTSSTQKPCSAVTYSTGVWKASDFMKGNLMHNRTGLTEEHETVICPCVVFSVSWFIRLGNGIESVNLVEILAACILTNLWVMIPRLISEYYTNIQSSQVLNTRVTLECCTNMEASQTFILRVIFEWYTNIVAFQPLIFKTSATPT